MNAEGLTDYGVEIGHGLGGGVGAGGVAGSLGADVLNEPFPDALVLKAVIEEGLKVDSGGVRAGNDYFPFVSEPRL